MLGVVERPTSKTSKPHPIKVPETILLTISPEIRASRPIIIVLELERSFLIKEA